MHDLYCMCVFLRTVRIFFFLGGGGGLHVLALVVFLWCFGAKSCAGLAEGACKACL